MMPWLGVQPGGLSLQFCVLRSACFLRASCVCVLFFRNCFAALFVLRAFCSSAFLDLGAFALGVAFVFNLPYPGFLLLSLSLSLLLRPRYPLGHLRGGYANGNRRAGDTVSQGLYIAYSHVA
ncbi:hypothetical protein GGS23DRAFT_257626 [Durotheca rogersii]|uniref:uncharacterized protein n=1 Tax=Durotheca rogersii TaxID=419775 RepID=UPI00221F9DCD|nr:uncharacterized protein GGS23DRAFT_257626 [Durotheca rogersii]KAI5859982.1 hypothetical protein GGS23DRAFT_257626 [Durotheca rogersii]